MAERQISQAPAREERGVSRRQQVVGWAESPIRAMQKFAEEMDRMFDDFGLGRRWERSSLFGGAGAGTWAPEVEVFQKNNELTIRVDLPGLTRDEVSVEVSDNAVTIQGERRREHEEDREGIYRSERSYGTFFRTIPLPEGAIADQAKATFRDGVLDVTMPAPPAGKGRKLEITEGNR